jgi:hypothetical protein
MPPGVCASTSRQYWFVQQLEHGSPGAQGVSSSGSALPYQVVALQRQILGPLLPFA